MKCPKRGVQIQRGFSRDQCTTQEETRQIRKATNGHKCASLEEEIKLEVKAFVGTNVQLLSSTTQPPQYAQLQCLKDNLKLKLQKVKSMSHLE
jgi:hypothetical protein